MGKYWDHNWKYALALMKGLDRNELQLANCNRIDDNDAVYIFDEVGSGKTITAGLIALHYLWNYRADSTKNVLVITTKALTQGENGGQFLNDWYSKLPFDALGLKGRVTVINHYHTKITGVDPSQYGLVIIDEAQEFLNSDTERYKSLEGAYKNKGNSDTEKVVFLTATPIKGAMRDSCPDRDAALADLGRYSEMAKMMLTPNYQREHFGQPWTEKDWRKSLMEKAQPNKKEELICAEFDGSLPVTRYFKDTVLNLDLEEQKTDRTGPERGLPKLWYWNQEKAKHDPKQKKEFVLLENIRTIADDEEKKKKQPLSRFLVFVRYVEDSEKSANEDARYLLDYLKEDHNGIKGFHGEEKDEEVVAVTGTWRSDGLGYKGTDLSDYTGTDPDELPRILILTYPIAEAGVNLPGFNHVINYHISRFPSALEQRFGRVDRGNSLHEQIYTCYLLDESDKWDWDTNTNNFHRAIKTALRGLMPLLPSRNAFLSEDILREHIKKRDKEGRFINEMEELLRQDCAYEAYQIFQKPAESRSDIEDETVKKLIQFFEDLEKNAQKAKNTDEDDSVSLSKFGEDIRSKDAFDREAKKVINSMWKNWKETFSSGMDPEKYIPIIQKFQNDIFYMSADWKEQPGQEFAASLKGIKLETCRNLVRESMKKSARFLYPDVIDIRKFQEEELKPWENTLKKHEEKLNEYFCKQFSEGRLHEVFPDVYGYNFDKTHKETVNFYRECVSQQIFDDPNDSWVLNGLLGKGLIGEYCFLYLLRQLPFFKMCEEFETSLHDGLLTSKGEKLSKYEGDPFAWACFDIRKQAVELGLVSWEKEGLDKMSVEDIKNTWLTVDIQDKAVKASIWYQLVARFFKKHPEFDMISCFFSDENHPGKVKSGRKLEPRKNVKYPWPNGVDFCSLQPDADDYFTEYFKEAFRERKK